MATRSTIEWTESTWNPVTGCTKISAGCKYCYAERMAKRLKAMGQPNYVDGFRLTLQEHMLELPLRWKKPQVIFVNSMSDLFHKSVPFDYIARVFNVMERAHWHQFQVLTKRADRLAQVSADLPWPINVWMGVSVEDGRVVHRIDRLRETDAHIKFLSLEPLIGPLPKMNLKGMDWAIVGGDQWIRLGCSIFAISAGRQGCLSFLSSGVERTRRKPVVFCKAARMMLCRSPESQRR